MQELTHAIAPQIGGVLRTVGDVDVSREHDGRRDSAGVVREATGLSRWAWPAAVFRKTLGSVILLLAGFGTVHGAPNDDSAWVQRGFDDFSGGQFEDGGSNLYVNAKGVIEMIHRWDVNNDGFADLVLAQSHDFAERRPTQVFDVEPGTERGWRHEDLSGESGWGSRIADLDADGFADLVVANGDNGLSSMLSSYVYWGGKDGVGKQRTDLSTMGAYDVALIDINRDGYLDLVFPSAWRDRHNAARPRAARVYLGGADRQFQEATDDYNIMCLGTTGIAAADLNKDGYVDLVLANSRRDHEAKNVESFVYWGGKEGFAVATPECLPTYAAESVIVADLNRDGAEDIVFSGGNGVRIYWNRDGSFDRRDKLDITAAGTAARRGQAGTVHCITADVDGDGNNNLIIASDDGVEIRSGKDVEKIQSRLPLQHFFYQRPHYLSHFQ